MSLPIILAACAALLVAVLVAMRLRRARSAASQAERLDTIAAWPPAGIRILSHHEREAFAVLRAALPEHVVFAQVPLARFLKVPKRHSYTEWLRRLGYQCADLVVCDESTGVVAVVDVQPPPERMSERSRKRHRRIERALAAAGIRLFVWVENALPSVGAARRMIVPEAAPAGAAPAPTPASIGEPESLPPELDDVDERREPPPSTWFDEFDTAPAPLQQRRDEPR